VEIAFQSITKRFGDTVALEGVSFRAAPREVTGFVGRNGAGKTTALRVLLGLARPDEGVATFDGRHVSQVSPDMLGVAFAPAAHPKCRVKTHLDIRATRIGLPSKAVDEVLDEVSMAGFAKRKFGELSQGERQRIALAGAFLGDPQVLILDEPVNGLDPDGIIWLRDYLRSRAEQGATVLVSSHILAELDQMADSVVVLDRTVRWAGDMQQMRRDGFDTIESLYGHVSSIATKGQVS
jgi:ABC-2 type transport system ATP-binding protein